MLGKPNGSIGKWGRVIRVNDADPTQVLDQNGTGRLAEWRKAGVAAAWLDNDGKLTAAGLAAIVASQATGDTLYASSATAIARLGIGSTGYQLTVVGGLPAWVVPTFPLSGQATGDLFYASSATALARLAAGATDSFLTIQGGLPVWSNAFDPVWVIAGENVTPRVMRLKKSRGTVAAPTVLVTGDILGDLSFDGYVNAHFVQAGLLRFMSEGTIGTVTDRMPSVFEVWVNTDASPSVLTKRLSINSAGLITLPTATAAGSGLVIGTLLAIYQSSQGLALADFTVNNIGNGGNWLFFLSSTKIQVVQPLDLITYDVGFLTGANGQRWKPSSVTGTKTCNSGTGTETVSISVPLGAYNVVVTFYVETILAGAGLTTWSGGYSGQLTAWGTGLALAAGTATDVRNFLTTGVEKLTVAATTFNLIFTAAAGVFSSGVIRYTVSFETLIKATS